MISQHHKRQQVHVVSLGLDLLLRHLMQIQIPHIGNGAHCHCHQPEAVAAVFINHLYIATNVMV